jgi:hypothetical protein
MKYPKLQGTRSTQKHVIYFSCDWLYYQEHGIPLIKSIVNTIDWIGVHVHLVLYRPPTDLYYHTRVSYTYEIISDDFINSIVLATDSGKLTVNKELLHTDNEYRIKEIIYFSCARFIKLAELFQKNQFVLQIDADAILFNEFSLEEFKEVTVKPRGMRKPKDPHTLIASCISLGTGDAGENFKNSFSTLLQNSFSKGAYWYIDQEILRKVFYNIEFETINTKWCNWGLKKTDYFSTGKGSKKTHPRFVERVKVWKDI